jgi:ketosteroid isomerase-like protein
VDQEEFQVIRETWAAFNRDDLDAGLERIHEDGVIVPFGAALEGRRYEGHPGIRDWFRNDIQACSRREDHGLADVHRPRRGPCRGRVALIATGR